MGTRHRWAPRHNPTQLRYDSPTRNTPIIAYEIHVTRRQTLLSQHIVTVVTNVIAPTRTKVNTTTAPITNTYIKTYEHVMLSDAASSLSQCPSWNATKQLQETHSHSQHTRSICYQVLIIIVTVYHRIARRSNCALSNNDRLRNSKKLHLYSQHTRSMCYH